MKITLDAMGGDNAPEAPVLGAVEAAKTYGIEIVLVGRGEDTLQNSYTADSSYAVCRVPVSVIRLSSRD